MITLRKAVEQDLPIIQSIGTITYTPTYGSILEKEQISYMLSQFYSLAALRQQMMDGHVFLIATIEGKDVGFVSYSSQQDGSLPVLKLHKLYVLPEAHGQGLGKFLMNEVRDKGLAVGAMALRLNVNRYNKAKEFYERAGFSVIETVDISIGNDFYMNDYVMELPLR